MYANTACTHARLSACARHHSRHYFVSCTHAGRHACATEHAAVCKSCECIVCKSCKCMPTPRCLQVHHPRTPSHRLTRGQRAFYGSVDCGPLGAQTSVCHPSAPPSLPVLPPHALPASPNYGRLVQMGGAPGRRSPRRSLFRCRPHSSLSRPASPLGTASSVPFPPPVVTSPVVSVPMSICA